jgi:hypothetical protein
MNICERLTQEQDPVEFQQQVVDLLDLLERVAPEKEDDSQTELKFLLGSNQFFPLLNS